MIDIFIPSYHRPQNIKTAKYFISRGYDAKKIHVFIDSEADDKDEYECVRKALGFNLHVFDMEESRTRYDYVHRPSVSRRSAGQARNMFYDVAKTMDKKFYVVIDDDTSGFEIRPYCKYYRRAKIEEVNTVFESIKRLMEKWHLGLFGLSQTGEMMNACWPHIIRRKVMNTTFVHTDYIYRGERGYGDDDTSQFSTVMNEGYLCVSLASGLVLQQTQSATASGGLTDLYKECQLLNKSLVVPIQFPSCARAERQIQNGNRLHHRINYRYLMPKIIRGKRSNIEWDSYIEDIPFTNEPLRHAT